MEANEKHQIENNGSRHKVSTNASLSSWQSGELGPILMDDLLSGCHQLNGLVSITVGVRFTLLKRNNRWQRVTGLSRYLKDEFTRITGGICVVKRAISLRDPEAVCVLSAPFLG